MNISVTQDVNLDEELAKAKELLELQAKIADEAQMLRFITIKEFMKMSGWSQTTVQNLYNCPDFPCCDYGKEKIAEIHALIKYFSVPRRKRKELT